MSVSRGHRVDSRHAVLIGRVIRPTAGRVTRLSSRNEQHRGHVAATGQLLLFGDKKADGALADVWQMSATRSGS